MSSSKMYRLQSTGPKYRTTGFREHEANMKDTKDAGLRGTCYLPTLGIQNTDTTISSIFGGSVLQYVNRVRSNHM